VSQGKHDQAKESMQQGQQLAERIGHEWTDMYVLVLEAEVALLSGQYAVAIVQVQNALAQSADSPWMQGRIHRLWARAVAALDPARWDEAEEHFTASLSAFEPGEAHIEAAHTHVVWGKLLAQRGNTQAAREHLVQAAAQYEESELTQQVAEVTALLAEVTDAHEKL
jgi:ATP/maltotriose-dependent transcriptional regulator MalT